MRGRGEERLTADEAKVGAAPAGPTPAPIGVRTEAAANVAEEEGEAGAVRFSNPSPPELVVRRGLGRMMTGESDLGRVGTMSCGSTRPMVPREGALINPARFRTPELGIADSSEKLSGEVSAARPACRLPLSSSDMPLRRF